jgi:hypothetical protein
MVMLKNRAITNWFFLDQQIGLESKMRVDPDVDLRSMLFPTQSKSVKPMRSITDPDA